MCLQRLFSTFAEGWPGAGLLLQRVLTSTILLYCGATHLLASATLGPNLPHLIAAVAGILLLLGFWTPFAGIAIAIIEVWVFSVSLGNSLTAVMLAAMGASLSMIGPGIWSIDARLYGRKHLEDPRHYRERSSSESTTAFTPAGTSKSPYDDPSPDSSDLTL